MAGVRIGFGHVWGSEVSARRPHQNAFPGHQISYRRTFCRIYQHCMDGSRMRKNRDHSGHQGWITQSWMTLLTFLWLARGIVQLHNAWPILGCACTLVTCKQCNAYAHCSFVSDVCSHMLVIFSSCSSCSSQNGWYFVRWHHKLSHSASVGTNQSSQNYWVMISTKIFMEYVMGMIWDTPLGFPVFQHWLIGNLLWLRNLSIML